MAFFNVYLRRSDGALCRHMSLTARDKATAARVAHAAYRASMTPRDYAATIAFVFGRDTARGTLFNLI